MQKQFVNYGIALKLKELGFDEKCIAIYDAYQDNRLVYLSEDGRNASGTIATNESMDFSCLAPLYQQVVDWFRETHCIFIEINVEDYFGTLEESYSYQATCKVVKSGKLDGIALVRDEQNNHIFYSYYKARENSILKAIELCQNKKS